MHRLHSIVEFNGKEYEVVVANECRTRLQPVEKETRTVTDRVFNRTVQFQTDGAGINIAPTTPLKVVRVLDKPIARVVWHGFILPVGSKHPDEPEKPQQPAPKRSKPAPKGKRRKVRRSR